MPNHLAVIMDGNGRWATQRGMHRWEGHQKGAQVAENMVRWCNDRGVKYLTLFSFSTENWKRPPEEIRAIFSILVKYLKERTSELVENNVKIKFIGNLKGIDEETENTCIESEKMTARCGGMQLNIAVNYGGRYEITRAAREWDGEGPFEFHLYTAGQPDPDFLIRTGGERRISNFMLWQLAYTELYFSDILWPDFTEKDLDVAFKDFFKRQRKYGGVS